MEYHIETMVLPRSALMLPWFFKVIHHDFKQIISELDPGVMVVLGLVESTQRETHFPSAIDHLAMIMTYRLLLIEEK